MEQVTLAVDADDSKKTINGSPIRIGRLSIDFQELHRVERKQLIGQQETT
jgi:hypothetical protein